MITPPPLNTSRTCRISRGCGSCGCMRKSIMLNKHKSSTFASFFKTRKTFIMAVITLGTMAFDAIETPFGKIDRIVGGSATYVAYAASHLVKPIRQISIVGEDFPLTEMEELKSRGVEVEGVKIVK